MQRWNDEFVGSAQRKRVYVHHNGDFDHGKVLYMEPDWDHLEFLNAASQRLEMVPAANRVFNADGAEIDDCMMIEDDDMLFLSINDDFIAPADLVEKNGENLGGEGEKIPHIISGYKVGELLGRGGFGEVRVGEHSLTGDKVALKFLRKSEILSLGAAERTNTEIQCLIALKHAHIIRLQQNLETQNHVVLVFELMQGGDLLQYLVKRKAKTGKACLTEDEARHVFYQVLSAVSYAHNQHICHRDLKLENILLKDNTLSIVKIADFGLSDFYRPGAMIKSSCGTLSFLAPEVFKGTANAGPPLDVWSLGVILFAIVCGRLPFEGPDLTSSKRPRDTVIRARIIKCQYKIDEGLGGECKDLLRRLLAMDPAERMTIPEIFNHVWVRTTVPAHVIESYQFNHFPASERLTKESKEKEREKDMVSPTAGALIAGSAQIHPIGGATAGEGLAAKLPSALLPSDLQIKKRISSATPDLPDAASPTDNNVYVSSRRPSEALAVDELGTPRSSNVYTFDQSPPARRIEVAASPVLHESAQRILSNGTVDGLSRENSEESESAQTDTGPPSARSEPRSMIRLIPLRKELRAEDSVRRMSITSAQDDDASVTSARTTNGPSSASVSRRSSEAQHHGRRSEILNSNYEEDHPSFLNSKNYYGNKKDIIRSGDIGGHHGKNDHPKDRDSLYHLMSPTRSTTGVGGASTAASTDGGSPGGMSLTDLARHRNSLMKEAGGGTPGYMGSKGRQHVLAAGITAVNKIPHAGSTSAKPRFGL